MLYAFVMKECRAPFVSVTPSSTGRCLEKRGFVFGAQSCPLRKKGENGLEDKEKGEAKPPQELRRIHGVHGSQFIRGHRVSSQRRSLRM